MFIRGLSDAIKAKLAFYGHDGIEPGDILLTNDAYIMGSHLNHLIFTLPIFHDGEIVGVRVVDGALASTSAARSAARTQDIFSEGLQLPIVKIFKRGVQDDELTRIIRTNVRLPELAMGDFRAQIAAIRTGEARYGALLQQVRAGGGRRQHRAIVYAMSERMARAAVAAIPDGMYEAESFMDDDGIGDGADPDQGARHRRRRPDDDRPQRRQPAGAGYFNSGATAGRSRGASRVQVPHDADAVSDQRRRVPPARDHPAARAASISATKPAAMRWWMTIPMTVVDTIFRALAPAIPERVAAGHHADLCSATMFGINPRTGRFFTSVRRPARRRLGRQARQRRHERGRVHQRRRHAQLP